MLREVLNIIKSRVSGSDILFKDSFFSAPVIEWNNFDSNIWNLPYINVFKEDLLKFTRAELNLTNL